MRFSFSEPPVTQILLDEIKESVRPIEGYDDLALLINKIKNSKIVMLGEASHGTSEYYRWRTVISQKLIEEHGFNFIAVEGDWPDCYQINRFIKGESDHKSAWEVLNQFHRWPTWMWANNEVLDLVKWLRHHNDRVAIHPHSIGFYGLDVYSLWESLEELMNHLLAKEDKHAYLRAKAAMDCFQLLAEKAKENTHLKSLVPQVCRKEIIDLLASLKHKQAQEPACSSEKILLIEQNAKVIENAEAYYRKIFLVGPESWNLRDQHMADTLDRLLDFYGPEAKGIVWEHNTHIGDARYTDMAASGMHNIGQLAREAYGNDQVSLVGFGSYEGSVIASEAWGAPMQRMEVPHARRNSWEQLFHEILAGNGLYLTQSNHSERFLQARGHRAIGVVYRPEADGYGNYVPSVLPLRYDAWIFIDRTEALHPIQTYKSQKDLDLPETFPSAV